jgi:hypothetical protein
MVVRQPRYSKEEFALRGDKIYESQVRYQVEDGNHGKIVALGKIRECLPQVLYIRTARFRGIGEVF